MLVTLDVSHPEVSRGSRLEQPSNIYALKPRHRDFKAYFVLKTFNTSRRYSSGREAVAM